MSESKPAPHWTYLFLLWLFQAAIALWKFARLPSDSGNALILGLSITRLAGICILILLITAFGLLAYLTFRRQKSLISWLDGLLSSNSGDLVILLSLVVAFSSLAVMLILTGLSRAGEIYQYYAYAVRLAPFLVPAFFSAIELIVWIAYHRGRTIIPSYLMPNGGLRRLMIVWAGLGVLALFITVTGLGIVPDYSGDWGYPGVPLLEWQILLVCILAIFVLILEARGVPGRFRRIDLWLSIGIWLAAALLWLSQPIVPSHAALAPRPPNDEIYPFGDAQVYDGFAQSILIGDGLKDTAIPTKPLYVIFLAILHLLVGQKYEQVILAQSLLLAIFPVALYWIGKDFFGRPVGISVAILSILRDITSNIAAPFTHALSYTKLYLSEIPVAIPLVLFIFIAYRWAQKNQPSFLAFLAGGILGIGILIRTQAGVALPVILLIAWWENRKALYPILRGGILMALGIALVISPWIWRNWKVTGEFIFDDPGTQTINLAQRYNNLIGREVYLSPLAGESLTEFNRRLISLFTDAVASDPGIALHAFANRFLNNCVGNLLILPLRNDLVDTRELWQPSRPFWEQWDGSPTPWQSVVLAFYILVFGLGLGAAWQRLGVWAFAPLGVNLLYILLASVALLSGQRFLLSMDWSIYLIYMVGFFVLIQAILLLLRRARPYVIRWVELNSARDASSSNSASNSLSFFLVPGAFLFLIGASLPLSEMIFPKRYPALSQPQIFAQVSSSPAFLRSDVDSACLQKWIADEHLTGYTGRALSPRYYESGEGEPTAKLGYAPSPVARLVFQGVGNRDGVVIVPMAQSPEFFPHAADVLFYIGPDQPYDARFILVTTGDRQEFYVTEDMKSIYACTRSN